jgi:hypothetical protein
MPQCTILLLELKKRLSAVDVQPYTPQFSLESALHHIIGMRSQVDNFLPCLRHLAFQHDDALIPLFENSMQLCHSSRQQCSTPGRIFDHLNQSQHCFRPRVTLPLPCDRQDWIRRGCLLSGFVNLHQSMLQPCVHGHLRMSLLLHQRGPDSLLERLLGMYSWKPCRRSRHLCIRW